VHLNIYPLKTLACKYFIWQLLLLLPLSKIPCVGEGAGAGGAAGGAGDMPCVTCCLSVPAEEAAALTVSPRLRLESTACTAAGLGLHHCTQAAGRQAKNIVLKGPIDDNLSCFSPAACLPFSRPGGSGLERSRWQFGEPEAGGWERCHWRPGLLSVSYRSLVIIT